MARVLIVDDDAGVCWALQSLVEGEGHEVALAASLSLARERLAGADFELAFVDVRLPDGNGLELLEPSVSGPVMVVMTAHGDLEVAVEAMQRGAFDYLAKPMSPERTRELLGRALAQSKERPPRQSPATRLVGKSAPMQELYKAIALVAPSASCVLIQGETGSGKELVARSIHALSPRRAMAFETVDCGALPAELLESELYGHERGAFTGAVTARPGRFRRADGGSLFLDEIAELPASAQAKLLRFLAEGTVQPVGGGAPVRVDVRTIVATHVSLEQAVADGRFRRDLFHRIKVLSISLPPLRDRREDLPVLAEHFLAQFESGKTLSAESQSRLSSHDWPGNVRELRNVLERAHQFTRGAVIHPSDLGELSRGEAPSTAISELRAMIAKLLDEAGECPWAELTGRVEEALIAEALERAGSQAGAARMLGVSRTTLRKRLGAAGPGQDAS